MVGKQSSVDIVVTYDDAPGGTGRVITNFVMELGGAKIEVDQTPSEAFGDAWKEHTPTGMRSSPAIKVSGQFDTTTVTGPHVVFMPQAGDAAPNALTRTLTIGYGDAKTFTVETRLMDYSVVAKNGNLTEFEATVQPTGPAAWT